MLRDDFVPVALDVWYEERRQDAVGDFYRKIVAQRDGLKPGQTTQGFYIAGADGSLLQAWNNRDPDKLARLLRGARRPIPSAATDTPATEVDAGFARSVPKGAAVLDVFAKITDADWPEAKRGWFDDAMRSATGRDHLWITQEELAALAAGTLPDPLARRIARFHLIDNTRGEPPMWRSGEVRELDLELASAGDGKWLLTGVARLATARGERRCDAAIRAEIAFADGRLERFDLVARCSFAGEGQFTPHAPPGTFTLVVATRIASGAVADAVPPQAARDLRDYLTAR